jgi:hypothetical protein
MTKPQAYSLTGKKLHVEPTRIIRFSGNIPMQTFLVFTGSSAQTVEIPMKFKPYTHRAFRPRLQQFYL